MISVIIPAFNEELTIARAVRSAFACADHVEVEVIVVDDCSSDDTVVNAMVAGATVAKTDVNSGPSVALNKALELVQGDWVICLAADDWLEPNGVGELLKRVAFAPASFAYGMVQYHGQLNTLFVPSLSPDFYSHNASLYPILYHRDWIERGVKYHTFDAGYGLEDWDFILQLIEKGAMPLPIRDVMVLHHVYSQSGLHVETLARNAKFMDEMRERHPNLKEGARI